MNWKEKIEAARQMILTQGVTPNQAIAAMKESGEKFGANTIKAIQAIKRGAVTRKPGAKAEDDDAGGDAPAASGLPSWAMPAGLAFAAYWFFFRKKSRRRRA